MAVRSAGAGRRAAFEARLRPMGPRGEGWIGLQMVVQIGALVIATLTGPVIGGPARVVLAVIGIALMAGGVLLFALGGRPPRAQLLDLGGPAARTGRS